MLTILMQLKVGLPPKRLNCMSVVGLLALICLCQSDLNAELIPAVEHTGSSKLRGMIESDGAVYDRLLSWSEFACVVISIGAQGHSSVRDAVEFQDEQVDSALVLSPILGMHQGGATNSLDSSGSASSSPQVFAANLASCSDLSDPVVLLYWRGWESLHIPDAPSSSLFRPPRQLLFDTAV